MRMRSLHFAAIVLLILLAFPSLAQTAATSEDWAPVDIPGDLLGTVAHDGIRLASVAYRFAPAEPRFGIRRTTVERQVFLDVHDALWKQIDEALHREAGDTCKYKLVIHSRPRGTVREGRLGLGFEFTCHARNECKVDPKVRITLAVKRSGHDLVFSDAGHKMTDLRCNGMQGALLDFAASIHDPIADVFNGHHLDRVLFPQLARLDEPFPAARVHLPFEGLLGSLSQTPEQCLSRRNSLLFEPVDAAFSAKHGNSLRLSDRATISEFNARCFRATLVQLAKSLEVQRQRVPKTGTVHVATEGEHLWGLAEQYYGDGSYHNLLRSVNREVLRADGLLRVGDEIRIVPITAYLWSAGDHLVGPGESLWSIAETEGRDFATLVEESRAVTSDPDVIVPLLSLPATNGDSP